MEASTGSAFVEEEEEPRMVIRIIADDNSCLFNAVAYVLASQPLLTSSQLRTIVADCILSNPYHFTRPSLNNRLKIMCNGYSLENSWGGAIELGILAEWFDVQIASVDVQTGRIDFLVQREQRKGCM